VKPGGIDELGVEKYIDYNETYIAQAKALQPLGLAPVGCPKAEVNYKGANIEEML